MSDEDSLLKLAFQWRFHEHPHPFQLLEWSHQWRTFVRNFQASPVERLERIAYAWIFYQLKWLTADVENAPSPLETRDIMDADWNGLLSVNPPSSKDRKLGRLSSQDWRTRTLPLLARPEIGLPPKVKRRLLEYGGASEDPRKQCKWLRDQRRRLVTDAIIAAGEEGRRAENAENAVRVERIVEELDAQHSAAYGEASPWVEMVEQMSDDTR